MYEVICMFMDLQDLNHVYNVGDKFPRVGAEASNKRFEELASKNNRQNKPLIRLVGEEKQVEQANLQTAYTKTDINRLSKSELVDLANEVGLEDTEDANGSDLKKMLIEYYRL